MLSFIFSDSLHLRFTWWDLFQVACIVHCSFFLNLQLDSWGLWSGSFLLRTLERGPWKALQLWRLRGVDPCGSHSYSHWICWTRGRLTLHILGYTTWIRKIWGTLREPFKLPRLIYALLEMWLSAWYTCILSRKRNQLGAWMNLYNNCALVEEVSSD